MKNLGPRTAPPLLLSSPSGSLIDTRKGLFCFTHGRSDLSEEDFPYLLGSYKVWVRSPLMLSFYNPSTSEIEFRRASKRGNHVYRNRILERLDGVMAQLELNNVQDRFMLRGDRGRRITNCLFITLTWDSTKYPHRFNSWRFGIQKQYNNFITRFRQRYGKTWVYRVGESTKRGYPHLHLVVICESEFNVFQHNGKYRIQEKGSISDLWGHHVDVEAIWNLKSLDNYLRKDLDKQLRLSCEQGEMSSAFNWLFRKRAFAISQDVEFITVCVSQIDPALEQVIEAEKEGLLFLGVVNLTVNRGFDPPDCVSMPMSKDVLLDLNRCISNPSRHFEKLLWDECRLIRGWIL